MQFPFPLSYILSRHKPTKMHSAHTLHCKWFQASYRPQQCSSLVNAEYWIICGGRESRGGGGGGGSRVKSVKISATHVTNATSELPSASWLWQLKLSLCRGKQAAFLGNRSSSHGVQLQSSTKAQLKTGPPQIFCWVPLFCISHLGESHSFRKSFGKV